MDNKEIGNLKVKDIQTLREWRELKGVPQRTANAMANSGAIPAFKLKGLDVWFIPKESDTRSDDLPKKYCEYKLKEIEPIKEWAEKNKVDYQVAMRKARDGFIPAFKLNRSSIWFIKKDVKNFDNRTLKTPRNSAAKIYYDKNLANHCCVRCGRPLPENYNLKTCPDCREKLHQKRLEKLGK